MLFAALLKQSRVNYLLF